MKKAIFLKIVLPIIISVVLIVALVLTLVFTLPPTCANSNGNPPGTSTQQPNKPTNPDNDSGSNGGDSNDNDGNGDDSNAGENNGGNDTDNGSNDNDGNGDDSNTGENDGGSDDNDDTSTSPVKYTITFNAWGATVSTQEFVDANSEITLPTVPEKAGYTGKWGEYDLGLKQNLTVEAIYTPIVYTIEFHMVKINATEVEVDYLGSWDEFWCNKSVMLANRTSVREYTVETDDVSISTVSMGVKIDFLRTVFFEGFYTDELCTQAFSGNIPKGSTGNIKLYAKVTSEEVGGI